MIPLTCVCGIVVGDEALLELHVGYEREMGALARRNQQLGGDTPLRSPLHGAAPDTGVADLATTDTSPPAPTPFGSALLGKAVGE